jgi:carboxymethylenebutenolidase
MTHQQISTSDKTVPIYLSLPASGQGPGVLLLPTWWGLNPFFKQLCERLAGEGFVTLAPDLYHGATAQTIEEAVQLRDGLERNEANKEVLAAADYLLAHSAVNQPRLGVIGFSLGTRYALEAARSRPQTVKAVVLFYGKGGGKVDKTQAAYLGHFAERDEWGADRKKVEKLAAELRAAQRETLFHTYPGTEHWFFEADRSDIYRSEAAQLAWERTVEFLHKHL